MEEKKPATKKSPAKKTEKKAEKKTTKTVKATSAKKAPATKKASPKTSSQKTPLPISEKKSASSFSKGKLRKKRVEEKFSGRKYTLGVGKRKTAIALVRVYEEGKGEFLVNNVPFGEYFFGILEEQSLVPLVLLGKEKGVDISIKVTGGGISSQAGAVAHGISRALVLNEEESRPTLKKAGLLTRDARVKERKKPGLKRARRAPQWKKR